MKRIDATGGRLSKGHFLTAVAMGVMTLSCAAISASAQAQAASAQRQFDFDLPSQPLARSVSQVASQSGMQVLFDGTDATEANAPALKGRMTAEQALARILAGSGLTYQYVRPGVITLRRAEGNVEGERVTGAVRVEGAQGSPYFGGAGVAAGVNGINGSRDITATEGTGSFTSGALTIGSKVPQAMKDVPQSISVLTNERMVQQNVTDFNTAMKQMPGVALIQGTSSIEQTFFSRGFEISSIQVDGGAPLTTRFGAVNDSGFFPQIDMSIYDHVELLRGAAGLFGGYGDPSGTVNLVRKKPLDHPQYALELQAGSWNNYRVVADATAPLAFDGRLRGRLVTTWQSNQYFYRRAKENKQIFYGVAEFDVTPTTLLTGGINYTKQQSVPWIFGLPRYQTGADLGLPRSTSVVFPWNRWNFETTEFFGSIDQKLTDEWKLKLNFTHNRQDSNRKLGYGEGAIDPATNRGQLLRGRYGDFGATQFTAEATVTGAVEIFGQRQEFVFGANRAFSNGDGIVDYGFLVTGTAAAPYQPYPGGPRYYRGSPDGLRPPVNIFTFDPNDPLYSEPPNAVPTTRHPLFGQIQSGIYMNMRLTAFDRLHLTTGLRWSKYESRDRREILCTNTTGVCLGKKLGDVRETQSYIYSGTDFSWPPSTTLSFDVTKRLSAYLGYTDIYQNQSTLLDSDLKPLDPITGSNWEAGLKWAARDGVLNLSLAAYQIKKKGFSVTDGAFDPVTGDFVASNGKRFPSSGRIDDTHSCCYKADPNRTFNSKGIDFDVTGEVLPGWQIAASVTYNVNKYEGSFFGPNDGKPFLSIQPKLLYKLWMSHDFGVAHKNGFLSGLTISGGANGQSSGYRSGTGCKAEFVIIDSFQGTPSCAVGGSYDYAYTVPAYVVFSGRIDYRFSERWSVSVNLENTLDKRYYASVGGDPSQGNWYGTPRSVTATLRSKW